MSAKIHQLDDSGKVNIIQLSTEKANCLLGMKEIAVDAVPEKFKDFPDWLYARK